MKIKVNRSQLDLITEMREQEGVREQEFLVQQTPTNMGEAVDAGRNWYTIEVTILSGLDDMDVKGLDDNAYFRMAYEDAKRKIQEAFGTGEFIIHSIKNKVRGSVNPDFLK